MRSQASYRADSIQEKRKKKKTHARKVRGKEHHFPDGAEYWEGRTSS